MIISRSLGGFLGGGGIDLPSYCRTGLRPELRNGRGLFVPFTVTVTCFLTDPAESIVRH
jgi:hypothetical protein